MPNADPQTTAEPPTADQVRQACITLIAAAHEKPKEAVTDYEVALFWRQLNQRRTLREAVCS